MEKGRTNVVNMTLESKKASFLLVVPHLDQSIITSRGKERQLGMEIDTSARPIMTLDMTIGT